MIHVSVQEDPFDSGALLKPLEALGGGGVASFTGLVRGDGGLVELLLEHHPGMTENVIRSLVEEAIARWSLLGAVVVHRHGPMTPGEAIVMVGTAARHRGEALDACTFLIDRLKTEAPFWKRERFVDGRTAWVEPRCTDDSAARRWTQAIAESGLSL
ncbi:molybdenum cofactor biosynthesis protein MoaE [uncultured Sphingomonas sp.]|uniref:molybdenum cofactor biosynthesis protein MoaE n=1 Tax=uncultured Sphingomonas sp. TaxID=158754 RepID=UPI0025D1E1A7|nr:molybdenum cofactor biosynthesis protein MoaE [uncultured Sphingomonas sp.]